MTNAMARMPIAASGMLPITLFRSFLRWARRETFSLAEALRLREAEDAAFLPDEDPRVLEEDRRDELPVDFPERDCAMFHVLLKTMSAAKQNAGWLKDFPKLSFRYVKRENLSPAIFCVGRPVSLADATVGPLFPHGSLWLYILTQKQSGVLIFCVRRTNALRKASIFRKIVSNTWAYCYTTHGLLF